jgi:hypothetical protein
VHVRVHVGWGHVGWWRCALATKEQGEKATREPEEEGGHQDTHTSTRGHEGTRTPWARRQAELQQPGRRGALREDPGSGEASAASCPVCVSVLCECLVFCVCAGVSTGARGARKEDACHVWGGGSEEHTEERGKGQRGREVGGRGGAGMEGQAMRRGCEETSSWPIRLWI